MSNVHLDAERSKHLFRDWAHRFQLVEMDFIYISKKLSTRSRTSLLSIRSPPVATEKNHPNSHIPIRLTRPDVDLG